MTWLKRVCIRILRLCKASQSLLLFLHEALIRRLLSPVAFKIPRRCPIVAVLAATALKIRMLAGACSGVICCHWRRKLEATRTTALGCATAITHGHTLTPNMRSGSAITCTDTQTSRSWKTRWTIHTFVFRAHRANGSVGACWRSTRGSGNRKLEPRGGPFLLCKLCSLFCFWQSERMTALVTAARWTTASPAPLRCVFTVLGHGSLIEITEGRSRGTRRWRRWWTHTHVRQRGLISPM